MPICQYFLKGNCKFGNKCYNEHASADPRQPSANFGRTNTSSNTSYHNTAQSPASIPLDMKSLRLDLQTERPIWPLSVYGHGKGEPCLISGTDVSQEEARLIFDEELRRGDNLVAYTRKVNEACANMQNQINSCLSNLSVASDRLKQRTQVSSSTNTTAGNASSVFGSNVSGFGSSPSQPQSVFGAGAVSNNSFAALANTNRSSSPFGQTHASQPVFGQSAFGSQSPATPLAFGKPLSTGQPVFGQSSAMSQPVFGQSSAMSQPVFGQSSVITQPVFGQTTFQTPGSGVSAFGQPAFGQSATSTNTNTTGASVFGQPHTPTPLPSGPSQGGSAFGQGAVFGNGALAQHPSQQQQSQSAAGSPLKPLTSNAILGQNTSSLFLNETIVPNASLMQHASQLHPEAQTAFSNAAFEFGKIPEIEPPVHLR